MLNTNHELGASSSSEISLSTQESIVPTASAGSSESTEIMRNIEELPIEAQRQLNLTYGLVVKKKLNEKIKEHLQFFLDKLNDSSIAELKVAMLEQLSDEDRQLFQLFSNSSTQNDMSYESVCKLYKGIRASIKMCEASHAHASNRAIFNAAGSGLDAMHYMVNYDVPNIIAKTKKIAIMQETRFVRVPKKKSLFRRFIETIFPFLEKKESVTVVKKVEEKITSQEKAVLGLATETIADHFIKSGKSYFKALDNAIAFKKKAAKNKALQILPTSEQVIQREEQEAKKEAAKNTTGKKMLHNIKTAAQVARVVDIGLNEWAMSKYNNTRPGAYLEHALRPDTEVTQTTLAEHFQNEFELASRKQSYQGLMEFARGLANIYITSMRTQQNGIVEMDPKKFGFKRIDDQNFEIFLSSLINSLGFRVNGYDDVLHFLTLSVNPATLQQKDYPTTASFENYKTELQTAQNEAFSRFAGALSNDPVLGIHAAVTNIDREHRKAMTDQGNENYFYVLNLQQQAIEELRIKERQQNAVGLACREFSLEEKIYNPNSNDLVSKVTGHLKSHIVGRMPELVNDYLQEGRKLQEHANNEFAQMTQNWLQQVSDLQNEAVLTDQKPVPIKGLNVTELRARWEKSAKKSAKLAFQFEEVKELVNNFHKSAVKEWTNSAIPLLIRCEDLGGDHFARKILEQLNQEHAQLVADKASKSDIIAIAKQIAALRSVLLPEGEIFSQELLKQVSPEILKLVFDAVNHGAQIMLDRKNNLSLDEKENYFMMTQALGSLGASYRSFDLAKKAYDQVYRTNYDTFDKMPATKVGKFIAQKLGEVLESSLATSMSSPIEQFEFYTQQKLAGRHQLSDLIPSAAEVATPVQSWYEMGKSYLSSALNYMAPAAVKAAEIAVLPLLIGGGSYYLARLYRKNVAPDPKSINQAVCDNAKAYIREQAYDAMEKMLPQMFNLHANEERFQRNHSNLEYDPFKQCGMCDRTRFYQLMDKVAKGLGFDSIRDYMNYKNQLITQTVMVENAKKELQATWFYKNEPQAKLLKAEGELAILQNILADKRKKFATLPETQEQLDNDLFVSLKDAIQSEYAQLTSDVNNGKLEHGTNYLVLVSSFNSMIQQIELVQRETIAAELFSPNIDEFIGYDQQATGVMAQLKLAAREEIKEYASGLFRKGILSQLSQSIETAGYFSSQLMTAVSQDLNRALQDVPYRQPPLATAFATLRENAPLATTTVEPSAELTQEPTVDTSRRREGPA